jgi:hypothetical protein
MKTNAACAAMIWASALKNGFNKKSIAVIAFANNAVLD